MKVIDIYNEVKSKYVKYVVMIKVGNFYEVYNESGYVIHNLLGYKVVGKNKRVGFPILAYNKVIECLDRYKINYVVVDGKVDVKRKFNRNRYDDYCFYEKSIDDRIDNIYDRLNKLKDEKSFVYLLDRIEGLL